MHGEGVYHYANGNIYSGTWDNDEKHGPGKMTLADGTKRKQEWENGRLKME